MVNKTDDMSAFELVQYITKTYHEPLRVDLRDLAIKVEAIKEKYLFEYNDLELLPELFNQFRSEILQHVTKEDFVVFPTIVKYERIEWDELINITDNIEIIENLVNNVQMKNEHWEFNSYLNSIIHLLNWSTMNDQGIKEFDETKRLFNKIHLDNIIHSKLENEDLYNKWKELQEKLKLELDEYL